MTAKRRLVPDSEVRRVLDTLRSCGVQIGAVDIRADGVTVYPPANTNLGGDSLGDYINRAPLRPKAGKGR